MKMSGKSIGEKFARSPISRHVSELDSPVRQTGDLSFDVEKRLDGRIARIPEMAMIQSQVHVDTADVL